MIATEKLWYLESKESYSQTLWEPAEYSQKLFADCEIIVDLKDNEGNFMTENITISEYLNGYVEDGGSIKDLQDATLTINDIVKSDFNKVKDMFVFDGMKIFIHEEIF